jgi:integrase
LADSSCEHDLPFVRFALAQATRRGEQMGLRWRDIDFEARLLILHGRHGLGTKMADQQTELGPEIRPLMLEAAEILNELLPKGGEEPDPDALVFQVGTGNAFSVRFGRITRDAGLQDLRFHDLRHDASTRLAKRYPNAFDLKRVTGHRNLASLDRYYQPDLSELARVGETIDEV